MSNDATIEVVLIPSATGTQMIATFDRDTTAISGGSTYDARRFSVFSDGTVGFVGKSGKTYSNSETSLTDIRKMVAKYTGFTVDSAFVNGTQLSLSSNTHSFAFTGDPQIRIGVENLLTTGKYPFAGKICAIRVYNKKLSSEELAKNLTYDNERFSLGLTL